MNGSGDQRERDIQFCDMAGGTISVGTVALIAGLFIGSSNSV